MFESCRAHFAMDAGIRGLIVLAAAVLVGAAAAASEQPRHHVMSVGPGRVGVLEATNTGYRVLLGPPWHDVTPPDLPGLIAKTPDGGRRWTRAVHPRAVSFVPTSGRKAWGSRERMLVRTDDAGRTWRHVAIR